MRQNGLPTLATRGLVLRPLTEADAPAIFGFTSDPAVTRYVLWPRQQDAAQTRQFIRRLSTPDVRSWVVLEQHDGGTVGIVFFHNFHFGHRKAEIACALAKPHWNKGYAIQASQAAMRHAFDAWQLHRIEAVSMPANKTSVHVLEKLGMTFEGIMRQSHWREDSVFDMKLYAILKREFDKMTTAGQA